METIDRANVNEAQRLRQTLGCFATGVTIITARNGEGAAVGITVNSFASLSLEPPLVLWSLSLKSPNLSVFAQESPFVVNILAKAQASLAQQFSRAQEDKFSGVACHSSRDGLPMLADALARLECRVRENIVLGDHLLVVGQVERHETFSGEPLLFYGGKLLKQQSDEQ